MSTDCPDSGLNSVFELKELNYASNLKTLRQNAKTLPSYNADISIFAMLLSWHGTVLPLVLKKPSYYVLVLSHAVWIGLRQNLEEVPSWLSQPEYNTLAIMASLTVFFLVFYVRPAAEAQTSRHPPHPY